MSKIMVTGCNGQIGVELCPELINTFGKENVFLNDIYKSDKTSKDAHFDILDITQSDKFEKLVQDHKITMMIHNAALLSATGEENPMKCIEVNLKGSMTALEIARKNNVRLLFPSSIAAFGPDSLPRDPTPDLCVQNPNTIYGVSKLTIEQLGTYYYNKFGTDFRCIRYPGIISYAQCPSGGTTDYSTEMFFYAVQGKEYTCPLTPDTPLPMLYMSDAIEATIKLLTAPRESLKQCVYNVNGFRCTPRELEAAIKKRVPDFKVKYEQCPIRQAIADKWPGSLDDANLRRDLNWKPKYDLEGVVDLMLDVLSKQFKK